VLSCWLADNFGRKKGMQITFLLTSVFFLLYQFMNEGGFRLLVLFIASFFTGNAYGINFIYTSELFPTSIRGTCCSLGNIFIRFGAMITPLILSKSNNFGLIFAIVSILAYFSLYYTRETHNQPIEDDVPEMHHKAVLMKDIIDNNQTHFLLNKLSIGSIGESFKSPFKTYESAGRNRINFHDF
jgi:MFS family permease